MNRLTAPNAYDSRASSPWGPPNIWDSLAAILIFSVLILVGFYGRQMVGKFSLGQSIPIYLEPKYLPHYAMRTVIRLFIALSWSWIFTFIFGTMAAKNRLAARIILPAIDILQSVPILSFLSLAIAGFIVLFKGNLLGPEFAAIFAVFTAQVWNITLGFYQSLSSVPYEFKEVGRMHQLSSWKSFWKIEVPFCMPSLVWNTMISMSGSWFFVIACEAFSVAGASVTLPGIGSYIFMAINKANHQAIYAAIVAMLLVILGYDQLIFRPLVYWLNRFEAHEEEEIKRPLIVELFYRGKMIHILSYWLNLFSAFWLNLPWLNHSPSTLKRSERQFNLNLDSWHFAAILTGKILLIFSAAALFGYIGFSALKYLRTFLTLPLLTKVLTLGVFTGIRVIVLVLLASVIWVPVGVWVGLRPRLVKFIQPLLQFVAAFPANLLFPWVAIIILRFKLNVELCVAPLMILGTQWYILFNVIAGISQLPSDLKLVAANLQISGWLWWKRIILPYLAPYLITGAITAAGGAWNASIVAEIVNWGPWHLEATGLGAFIQKSFNANNTEHLLLGTLVMCLVVLLLNQAIWQPLYNYALKRLEQNQGET